MTRAFTDVPQPRQLSAPKPAFQSLLHGGSLPESRAAMTGRRASRKEVWSTPTQPHRLSGNESFSRNLTRSAAENSRSFVLLIQSKLNLPYHFVLKWPFFET